MRVPPPAAIVIGGTSQPCTNDYGAEFRADPWRKAIMIRRILAGAAIAAAAFGFSATAASAGVGPNPNNGGQAILSQFQIIDDILNDVANHSLNDLEVEIINILDEVNVQALNNNQPSVGDHNKDTEIDNGHSKSE
ncbi:hypothetical protein ACFQ0B_13180 [Nonomuraea thailandensis]